MRETIRFVRRGQIVEIGSFDPMATLEGNEDSQNLAVSLKERFLKALEFSNDEPPSAERKLFSDE